MSEAALADAQIDGYHDHVRREVFHLIPKLGGTLLDIGGGVGATAAALKREGFADRIAVADVVRDKLPEVDASYSGDLNDPAFFNRICASEGRVQTILFLDVLEHLVDPWRVVRNAHGLLADGGVIVASVPNMRFWKLSWNLFAYGQFKLEESGIKDRTHLRWFVRNTARDLMTCSGLQIEAMEGRIPATRWKLANMLTLNQLRGLFELQYFMRVRKMPAVLELGR